MVKDVRIQFMQHSEFFMQTSFHVTTVCRTLFYSNQTCFIETDVSPDTCISLEWFGPTVTKLCSGHGIPDAAYDDDDDTAYAATADESNPYMSPFQAWQKLEYGMHISGFNRVVCIFFAYWYIKSMASQETTKQLISAFKLSNKLYLTTLIIADLYCLSIIWWIQCIREILDFKIHEIYSEKKNTWK